LGIQWASISSPMQSSLAQSDTGSRLEMFGALWCHAFIVAVLAALGAMVIVTWAGTTHSMLLTVAAIGASVLGIIMQDFVRRWLLATDRPGWALASDGLRQAGSLGILLLVSGSVSVSLWICTLVIGIAAALGCVPVASDLR